MKHKLSDRHHLQNLTRQIILACWVIFMSIGFVFGQTVDERKLELVVETGHTEHIISSVYSPNGKYLVTSDDSSVKIWNLENKEQVKSFDIPKNNIGSILFGSLVFSPDGNYVAGLGENKLFIWSIATSNVMKIEFAGDIKSFAFSPDGKKIASQNCKQKEDIYQHCEINLIDVSRGKELKKIYTYDLIFDPRVPIVFTEEELAIGVNDGIKILDSKTFLEKKNYKLPKFGYRSIGAISPKEIIFNPIFKTVALVTYDTSEESRDVIERVRIWDLNTGKFIFTLKGNKEDVREISISPNGKYVTGFDGIGTGIIWELENGSVIKTFENIYRFSFNPIKNEVATILRSENPLSKQESISFWNIDKREKINTLFLYSTSTYSLGLALSQDGKQIAYGGLTEIRIFDLEKNLYTQRIKTEGPTMLLFFGSNGNTISYFYSTNLKRLEGAKIGFNTWNILSQTVEENIFPDSLEKEKQIENIFSDYLKRKGVEINKDEGYRKIIKGDVFTDSNEIFTIKQTDINKYIFTKKGSQEKLFNLFLLGENDWVVITPDGRFDASEGALKLMHYAYGLEVINLDQLKEAYYEPGLLQKLLGYSKEPLRPIVPLKDVKLYPEIVEQKFDEQSGKLTVKLKNRGGGIGETRVLVNDSVVVPDARDDKLKANPNVPPDSVVTLTVDLPKASWLKGKENKITVVTSNYLQEIGKGNIQSRGAEIVYQDKGKEEATLPNLYAVVGGVSDYEGDQIDLRFAAKDAEDFSNALSLGARKLFCDKSNPNCLDKVSIKTLSTNRQSPDEQPTKENFRKAFAEIAQKAKPEDIVVVYLAGHGVTLGTGTDTYFYLTKEARAASKSSLETNFQTVAISNEELTDWLTPNPNNADDIWIKAQKRVLILDTCAAGNFAEKDKWRTDRDLSGDQIRAIDFLKGKTGTFILMGSSANQPSYESNKYGQGLLTFALLEGMKGQALQKPTDNIDVRLLFDYAEKRVLELGKDMNLDQRPIIKQPSGNTFVIGQMSDSEKQKISLPQPKTLMLRPSLGVLPINNDPLQLIPKLRKIFDAESSYEVIRQRGGKEPNLVYIDDDNFPGGIRITGTYTVEGENVKVKAYLVKDEKVLAELPEIVSSKDKILDELLKVVQKELAKVMLN